MLGVLWREGELRRRPGHGQLVRRVRSRSRRDDRSRGRRRRRRGRGQARGRRGGSGRVARRLRVADGGPSYADRLSDGGRRGTGDDGRDRGWGGGGGGGGGAGRGHCDGESSGHHRRLRGGRCCRGSRADSGTLRRRGRTRGRR